MNQSNYKPYLILFLVGAVFFFPWLGGVHLFDWDEINFAEISREMLLSGNFTGVTIDFQPFYQKPPLFFWLQAVSMKIFGIGEFGARFPNAVFGVLTLMVLFYLGRKHFDSLTGWLWAGSYFGSVLPFLYFKSGIIDPAFNFFIFLGLYFLIRYHWQKTGIFPKGDKLIKRPVFLIMAGLMTGLAILTKGPVAYLITGIVLGVYWVVYQRFKMYITIAEFFLFSASAALVTLGWFGLETLANGPEFVMEFTKYQYRLLSTPDAGHKGFPLYHVVVLLVGCFPASLFVLPALRVSYVTEEKGAEKDFIRWMKILFWTVLILFSIVQSKIVHYSSLAYFPLTFLAAGVIRKIIRKELLFPRWIGYGMIAVAILYCIIIVSIALVGYQGAEILVDYIRDPFAAGNLEAEVHWSGWEWLPALWLGISLLYFFRLFHRGNSLGAFRQLFVSMGIFTLLTLGFFVKRIEGYSQRAALEFFAEKAKEDAYLLPVGYKSYAHLFYGKSRPGKNEAAYSQDWLLKSPELDKPVYIATKVHKAAPLRQLSDLREIETKNGFVFFVRLPQLQENK